jgi:CheY-like chemotaxis protein
VQILVNLLTNAIRYSEPGGHILIRTTVKDMSVTLHVRDSGYGIAAADLQRVFDRFVQVGDTHHGGLGIGLALVKALAELHGGTVEARSDGPGCGAEFRITLPRTAAPALEAAPAQHSIAPCRILVVDDNRDAADMLGALLTGAGHHVVVSYDGEDALRRASSFSPQICLLDIGMPGMDGYQLASHLRRDAQGSELFLVAITGRGQEEDRKRAAAAGFDTHLTKPADSRQIMELLSRIALTA